MFATTNQRDGQWNEIWMMFTPYIFLWWTQGTPPRLEKKYSPLPQLSFFFSHNFFFGPHDEQICLGDYRVSFISSTLSLYLSLFCLNQCERLNTNFEKGAPRINTTKKSWKIIFFSAQMKKSERNCRPFPNVFLVHFFLSSLCFIVFSKLTSKTWKNEACS